MAHRGSSGMARGSPPRVRATVGIISRTPAAIVVAGIDARGTLTGCLTLPGPGEHPRPLSESGRMSLREDRYRHGDLHGLGSPWSQSQASQGLEHLLEDHVQRLELLTA